MAVGERVRERLAEPRGLRRVVHLSASRREVRPLDEFHRVPEDLAVVPGGVDAHDRGVVEGGGDPRLLAEALDGVRVRAGRDRRDLESLDAAVRPVLHLQDGGVPARPDRLEDLVAVPDAALRERDGLLGVHAGILSPAARHVATCYFFTSAFAFAKSPARTTESFAGSIHFRNGRPDLLGRERRDLLLELGVPRERPAVEEVALEEAGELAVLRAAHLPPLRQPDFAAAISSAVKPSFRARSSSSRTTVSSFAVFCGAWIA